jgi:hypothetical protein
MRRCTRTFEESPQGYGGGAAGLHGLEGAHLYGGRWPDGAQLPRNVEEPSRIKQMVFGGFSRCLYPLQKFDSDTERVCGALERDADKWSWLHEAIARIEADYQRSADTHLIPCACPPLPRTALTCTSRTNPPTPRAA